MKKISIAWEGPDQLIEAAVDALAHKGGWCEGATKSKVDVASDLINQFVRQTVVEHSAAMAEAAALAAVETSKQIATEQALGAVDLCTKSVGVEDV